MNVECPGYSTKWKWSSKHQPACYSQQTSDVSRERSASAKDGAQETCLVSPPKMMVGTTNRSPPEDDQSPRSQYSGWLSDLFDFEPFPGLSNGTGTSTSSRIFAFDEQYELSGGSSSGAHPDCMVPTDDLFAAPSSLLNVCESQGANSSTLEQHDSQALLACSPQLVPCPTLESCVLGNQLWTWEPLVIDYFFTELIPIYSLFDSELNPLRRVIERAWCRSEAVYHAVKSVAALCLAASFPELSGTATVERAAALACIEKAQPSVMREDLLLTYIIVGHTSSWFESRDLGLICYEKGRELLHDWNFEDKFCPDRAFWWDIFDFWKMLLAFATDRCKDSANDVVSAIGPRSVIQCGLPHPWTGIAGEAIGLLSSVGSLVYSMRQRLRAVSFPTLAGICQLQNDLDQARTLETALLVHKPADMSTVLDPGDSSTPKEHLQRFDEAYRAVALLQLYRVFPDLLSGRYRVWEEDSLLVPQPSSKEPSEDERDSWLTKLALHVIAILESIPFESRTRSVQPFFFIAVATELRTGKGESRNEMDSGRHSMYAQAARARRFICSRLGAYQEMLPIKKTKMFYDVVQQLWAEVDSGRQGLYWIDVLSLKDLETIMG